MSKKYNALSGFDQHFSNRSSPSRLILQIVTLQFFYYITAFVLFFITANLIGQPFDAKWMFSWRIITIGTSLGITLIMLWLFDSLISVIFIMLVIGRSKLAWDFAVTVHVINLMFAWLYEGFPKSISWWCLQVTSACIMVGLGTYSTRWKELRDTFFEGLIDPELGQADNMVVSANDDADADDNSHLKSKKPPSSGKQAEQDVIPMHSMK